MHGNVTGSQSHVAAGAAGQGQAGPKPQSHLLKTRTPHEGAIRGPLPSNPLTMSLCVDCRPNAHTSCSHARKHMCKDS